MIEEVPLTDLLQLFSTSQKSGVLVVNHFDDVGKIYLRDGRVFYATINDDDDIASRKAFFRMLSWEEGTFSLEQAGDVSFEDEIDESIENLLMEGMRQLDEMRNLGDNVPGMQDRMVINKPLVPPPARSLRGVARYLPARPQLREGWDHPQQESRQRPGYHGRHRAPDGRGLHLGR